MTDWGNLKEEMGGKFKNYYADGDYKAKCDGVEIKEVGSNGSVIMKFHFEETDEGQYPTADHWLSFKNEKWRKWHNRCLMIVLGASSDNAEKAVDMCENKSGKDSIVKAYDAAYKKLLAKKPEVAIEVYTDGEYARAEFKDRSVAMPHGNDSNKGSESNNPLAGAEDASEEIELSDLPF